MNDSFIKLHKEIIQLKSELQKRSLEYLKSKNQNIEDKEVDNAVNEVLNKVIEKVSKQIKTELIFFRL